MVLKPKGGTKSRSVKKGKVLKKQRPYNRKFNYKKKKEIIKEECCICYREVDKSKDNTITCGKKSTHTLCGECKVKLGNKDCPMCRSHKLPIPVNQELKLIVYSKRTRFSVKGKFLDDVDFFSPEELIRPRHLTK